MKILIASKINPKTIEVLEREHDVVCAFRAPEDVLKEAIIDRDIAIFRSGVQFSADVMRCAPNLKLLIRAGSGLDNVDVNYVRANNLTLERLPEPGARAVAELSFTFMLMLSRQIRPSDALWRQGRWTKGDFDAFTLRGKTLGIVGAGNIGALVGEMGVTWGMNVIGCVEIPTPEKALELKQRGITLTSCEEVLSQADYISIHVPLNDGTRNLIGAEELAMVKPSAFLMNLARGGVVNEDALYEALTNGRLAGAGIDVHVKEGNGHISPFAKLDNVVLTPHIGATTIDTQREIGERIEEIVAAFVKEHNQQELVIS